jgi:hypothetical protein
MNPMTFEDNLLATIICIIFEERLDFQTDIIKIYTNETNQTLSKFYLGLKHNKRFEIIQQMSKETREFHMATILFIRFAPYINEISRKSEEFINDRRRYIDFSINSLILILESLLYKEEATNIFLFLKNLILCNSDTNRLQKSLKKIS